MNTSTRALNADINVTPFLDVLLVLIITFLASVAERKALDVQLPIPCTGGCAVKDTPIVLEVLPHGAFLLNHHPVSGSALVTTLRSVYAGRSDKAIQVAGHRDVSYQTVLAAMDVARSAGVDAIAIPPSGRYSPHIDEGGLMFRRNVPTLVHVPPLPVRPSDTSSAPPARTPC